MESLSTEERPRLAAVAVLSATLLVAVLVISWRFDRDLALAATRAARGSVLVQTPSGAIEYQEAGTGQPLLVVHGSGGGHDQGMAFDGALAQHGIRVIAMSRFGYLRTPMPADATPAAQADAHACLLDALAIRRAAVPGGSAGAPSAMQMAIRHPGRVSTLVLMVPIAYKPGGPDDAVPPTAPWAERLTLRLIGSDLLFWAGLQVARDTLIRSVLATPPALVAAASSAEQSRVNTLLDNILPVSARAAGLRSDTALGSRLGPYALAAIRAPTLVISARDDGYGTYAGARYTASQIGGARFVGFDEGGHTWVGHDHEVRAEILQLLLPRTTP